MMTISTNLRIRLVRKVAPGMSRHQAAAHFDVSPSSAVRFAWRYEDEGTVAVDCQWESLHQTRPKPPTPGTMPTDPGLPNRPES